jgi:hypothetical protein
MTTHPDDPVYDDGSEVEIVTEADDPPSSGEWVDSEDIIHDPTPEELAAGKLMGELVDPDNDEDNGMDLAGELGP